jgi:trimethylamine--corrinoid protein Co-methyltransferase
MDMKFANVALGAPGFALLRVASAQLARMYGLPCGGGGLLTDSKLPDGQAGYEKLGTALLPALAGLHMISGAAAYGGELVLTLEGYILDDEVIGWVKRVLQGFTVDEEHLALDLISSQGPGGQFVQEDHTLHFFRQEMWIPTLSDRAATVAWMQDGGLSTRERARRLIRRKLEDYEPLELPEDMADRLQAIIDRSMAESQAAN